MEEAMGVVRLVIAGLVVVGVCVQLAVALRNRYVRDDVDGEKDEESFDAELELQLQGELDEAIKSSMPLLTTEQRHHDDKLLPTISPPHVRFIDEPSYESSWASFKRESRAELQQLGKTLMILSEDDVDKDESSDTYLDSPNGYHRPPSPYTHQSRSVRRQLPLLDSDGALAEKNMLVNAKQYSRILKRRLARQLIEEYFRTHSQPSSPKSSPAGSMRRAR